MCAVAGLRSLVLYWYGRQFSQYTPEFCHSQSIDRAMDHPVDHVMDHVDRAMDHPVDHVFVCFQTADELYNPLCCVCVTIGVGLGRGENERRASDGAARDRQAHQRRRQHSGQRVQGHLRGADEVARTGNGRQLQEGAYCGVGSRRRFLTAKPCPSVGRRARRRRRCFEFRVSPAFVRTRF